MFDNLRDFSDQYQDDPNDPYRAFEAQGAEERQPEQAPVAAKPVKKRRKSRNFLGMTAQQRFLITVMLFFIVVLMGTLAMFVTGTMAL
jgi:lipoprotein NlpI